MDNPKLKSQIETPALLIDLDRLEENIKKIADFFEHKKAKLRPHFKTHKSSELSLMQIAAGAKGMTCAKVGEAQVLVEAGIKDVLIANQIVETCKIQRLANLAKKAKITVIHRRNGYVVTDAGLKVCCQEKGKPAIKGYPGLVVSSLSEEHGKIIDEEGVLHFLKKLEYIPSHCCSTVNLHDDYYCIRGESLEAVWPVSGRGKSR